MRQHLIVTALLCAACVLAFLAASVFLVLDVYAHDNARRNK